MCFNKVVQALKAGWKGALKSSLPATLYFSCMGEEKLLLPPMQRVKVGASS